MNHLDVIVAGFGGQGILSCGRLLAYAGMLEGKNVSWLPSYGPEMRGGTANCSVIISEKPVGSPILNSAQALIVMNGPSLEKFENSVIPGGIIIVDSSLVDTKVKRTDVKVIGIPATQLASDMKNLAFANIFLLGRLAKETGIIKVESFEEALKKVLPERKHSLIPQEIEAFKRGAEY